MPCYQREREIHANRTTRAHEPAERPRGSGEQGMKPGVYIFKRDDEFLYVGSTRDLSVRPGKRDRGHENRFAAILQSNGTELIPCESFTKAQQLEERFVRQNKPAFNLRIPCAAADIERTTQIIRENW